MSKEEERLHKVQVCPATAFNKEISDESSANIFSAGQEQSEDSRVSPTEPFLCLLLEEEQILRHLQGPLCFRSTVHDR